MTSVEDPAAPGSGRTSLRSRLSQWLKPRPPTPSAAPKDVRPTGARRGEAAGWPVSAVEDLCRALRGFSDFHHPDFFQQVLVHLGRSVNEGGAPFAVHHHTHPDSRVVALVHAVEGHLDRDAALRALADTLRFLRREEAAVVRLDEIVDELAPRGGSRRRGCARWSPSSTP